MKQATVNRLFCDLCSDSLSFAGCWWLPAAIRGSAKTTADCGSGYSIRILEGFALRFSTIKALGEHSSVSRWLQETTAIPAVGLETADPGDLRSGRFKR